MKNLFTKHPHEVGETYWQHMIHAGKYTISFFKLFSQCLCHMFCPWMFNGKISDDICKISDHIKGRLR